MRIRKNGCAVDDTESYSGRCSSQGGARDRRKCVSRPKNTADCADATCSQIGSAGGSRAHQKSAETSNRRLGNMPGKYKCNADCPPAAGTSDGGELPGKGAVDGKEAAPVATFGIGFDEPEEFCLEKRAYKPPPQKPMKWPDEAWRKLQDERAKKKKPPPTKHIHPCVCDLSKKQRANIEHYLQERRTAQHKFERRVHDIEEEIRIAEEAEQQRLRELEAELEFYGDEYEMEGTKRKRKKRSARRASMVSLGVKQIINWRKPPKIEVRFTRTSNLRATSANYCKPTLPPLPQVRPVDINFEQPEIPIRANRTVELRFRFIKNHIQMSKEHQVKVKYPDRPPFVTQYW